MNDDFQINFPHEEISLISFQKAILNQNSLIGFWERPAESKIFLAHKSENFFGQRYYSTDSIGGCRVDDPGDKCLILLLAFYNHSHNGLSCITLPSFFSLSSQVSTVNFLTFNSSLASNNAFVSLRSTSGLSGHSRLVSAPLLDIHFKHKIYLPIIASL